LDKKSVLRLIIKEASFLKDSDFFGKQDPYIKFVYNGTELQTDVKDDAGKQAKWDETFGLSGISTQVKNKGIVIFQAFDKDIASSDFLGCTKPFKLEEHVSDDKLYDFDLVLYDKKDKKTGNLKLST